jgi:tetratricopeptide (TPR) repeat protein
MKTTLITLTLLLTACREASPPKASPPEPEAKVTGLRQLALEKVGGASTIDKRLAELQAMVEKNPAKLDAWILLGRAWIQKARQASDSSFYRNANACADVALELKPENALALNLKGMVMMNDHRFAEARDLAQRILVQDSDDIMALGTLSDASIELGDVDAAIEATQRMVSLKPNLPSYARSSYLRWLQGDPDAALLIIRQAIDAGGDPKDREPLAWVLVEAGKIFHHKGDYEGAIAGYDQALAVFADHPAALAWKARALLALGRPAEAKALAARSYGEAALAETAWIWADAAEAAGDVSEAMKAYALVEKLGRQGERRTLASFYASRNERANEAVELAELELRHRGDLYSHDAHAWALYRAGRMPEAKAAIAEASKLGTKDARISFHLGAILIATGEVEAGRAKIEEALRLSPAFDLHEAAEAQRIIQRS